MVMTQAAFRMTTKFTCFAYVVVCFLISCNSSIYAENIEQAWSVAVRESRELSAMQYKTQAAQAMGSAASAARLPSVTNVTAFTALSQQPEFKVDIPPIPPILPFGTTVNTPLLDQSFTVSTTYITIPIYLGGKITSLIEQADAKSRAAQSGERVTLQQLKLNVAESYLLVLRLQGLTEVLEEAEKSVLSHLKDVENLLKNGLATKNALLSAQVAYAEISQSLLQARNALDVASAAYNRFLWRPLDTAVELDLVNIPSLSGDLEHLTQLALSMRPELSVISAESQATEAKSREIRADRMPQVAAIGAYTYVQNEALNENNFFSGTIGMKWTPLDGGVSRAKQRALENQVAAINRMREDTKSAIILEVRKNWLEEQESRNRVDVALTAIKKAQENLKVVTEQFRAGLVTHSEVLDAVTLSTRARTNYCNAAYDAILATFRLRRASGNL